MKIQIKRYKIENSFDVLYESNWIVVQLIGKEIHYEFEFLTIEQIESLGQWLHSVLISKVEIYKFDFIDTDIEFHYENGQLFLLEYKNELITKTGLQLTEIKTLERSIITELKKFPTRYQQLKH